MTVAFDVSMVVRFTPGLHQPPLVTPPLQLWLLAVNNSLSAAAPLYTVACLDLTSCLYRESVLSLLTDTC